MNDNVYRFTRDQRRSVYQEVGPLPHMPAPGKGRSYSDYRQDSLRSIALQVANMRQYGPSDEQTIYRLMAWTETILPKFEKL